MTLCISCGGELKYHRGYVFRSGEFANLYGKKKVYRCATCTLSQIDSSQINDERLMEYYADDYRVVGEMGALSEQTGIWYKKRAETLASILNENLQGDVARAFEVGAGYGYNLLAIKKLQPNAELLTDEVSKSTPPADGIRSGSLEDGSYDVIVLSHVLEHFLDPNDMLDRCYQALSENGLIIIEVPHDVDNIERLNIVDEPHVCFFEKRSLKTLLTRHSGLELVDLWSAGPSYQVHSMKRSIRRFVGKVLRALPISSKLIAKRALSNTDGLDFSRINDQGVFLRALLRRK